MSTINLSSTATGTAITGSNDVINGAASDTLYLQGSSDTLNLVQGEGLNIQSGNNDVINLTDGAANVAANVPDTTLNGSGSWINASSGDTVFANGYYDGFVMANGDVVDIVSGGYDLVSLSSGVLDVGANEYISTLAGSSDVANVQSGDGISVNGNSDTINLANGDSAEDYGNANLINLSGGAINIAANIYNTSVDGSSSWVAASGGDTVYTSGYYDGFVMANGDTVDVLSGGYDLVSLSSGTLDLAANEYVTTLSGSNDVVNANYGADLVAVVSSAGDTVNMNSGGLEVGAGVSGLVLNGWYDTVEGLSGGEIPANMALTVNGNYDAVNVASGDNIAFNAGNTGDAVAIAANAGSLSFSEQNGAVDAQAGDALTVNTNTDVFNLANGDSLNLTGYGDQVNLNGGAVNIAANASYTVFNGSSSWVAANTGDTIYASGTYDGFVMANGDTVDVLSGGYDLVSLSSGVLDLASNLYVTTLSGSNDLINAGTGNTVSLVSSTSNAMTITGSSDVIDGSASDSLYLQVSSDTLNLAQGESANIESGNANLINLSGGAVNIAASISNTSFDGSSSWVAASSGDTVYTSGYYDGFVMANGDTVDVLSGGYDLVSLSSGVLDLAANEYVSTLAGSSDVANVQSGDAIDVNGNSDTINLANGDSANDYGNANLINLSGGAINIAANIYNTSVDGSSSWVAASGGDTVYTSGYYDGFVMANGDTVDVLSGGYDLVSLSSGTLDLAANEYVTTLSGSNDVVNAGYGADLVAVVSSAGDTVNMNSGGLEVGAGVTGLVLNGWYDTVLGLSGGEIPANMALTVNGNYDAVNVASGDNIAFNAGNTGDAVAIAANAGSLSFAVENGAVDAGSGDTISVTINDQTLNMANGDVANVNGTGVMVNMNSGTVTYSAYSGSGLTGSNNVVYDTNIGDDLWVNGNYNAIYEVTGGSLYMEGVGNNVALNSGVFNVSLNSGVNFAGSNDVVNGSNGDGINATGNNNNISIGTGGFVGVASSTGDTVTMNSGSLEIGAGVSGLVLNGSNDVVESLTGSGAIPANENLTVNGSNDVVNVTTGDTVFLSAGDAGDTINSTANSSDDSTITPVAGVSFTVDGGNDFVVATNVANDTINVGASTGAIISGSGDIIDIGANSSLDLGGNNDTVTENSDNSVYASGNQNDFNVGSGSYLLLGFSAGDTVAMNSDWLLLQSNITGLFLNGSNNDVLGISGSGPIATNDSLTVNGNNNVVNVTTGDNVIFAAGDTGDAIALGGVAIDINSAVQTDVSITSATYLSLGTSNVTSSYLTVTSAGETVVGTGLTLSAAAGVTLAVTGANDVVTAAAGDTVALSGTYGIISMTNGLLDLSPKSSAVLDGSGDVVGTVGAGSTLTVNGNNNTINAMEGDTIILDAGDSGDVINMFGGTVVLNGTSFSGITINGTGDDITGAGATLAGPVYVDWPKPVVTSSGLYQPPGVTITPEVIYDAGDIASLVSYFEANPNLSDAQIAADESDSDYQANLGAYLSGATLLGSSNALPSNVLAMLDGYSDIDVALYDLINGVNLGSELSEQAYIEQQFAWAESNYPIPTDFLTGDMQGLTTVLMSTNTFTQSLVSEAIGLLEQGNAGAAGGSQTPMLDDTEAELVLAIAENPSFSQTALLGDEVYTPDRSGHWQIEVQGNGVISQTTLKSAPLITTVLGDIDTYVVPIVDAAAAVFGQWEIIAAAAALDALQAGQDFADGEDLQGIFSALSAVAGGLSAYGAATNSAANIAAGTLDEAEKLGKVLSEGVSVAAGIDGIVTSDGNALSIITSAFNVGSGAAGYEGQTDIAQFAAVGAELGSATQALGTGNIVAALASLVEAAQTSGVISPIENEINVLWTGFIGTSEGNAALVQYAANTNIQNDGSSGSITATSASENSDGSVTFQNSDGSTTTYSGGSIAWRSNNPGNIVYNSFSQSEGAIGENSLGFAIFPNVADGETALSDLLSGSAYNSLTVDEAIAKFAPPSQNPTAVYQAYIDGNEVLGLPGSTPMSSLTSAQLTEMQNGIAHMEGYNIQGKMTNSSP